MNRPRRLVERRSLNYHLERSMSKDGKTMAPAHSRGPTKKARRVGMRDAEIRPALREHLLRRHASETDTVLIEELGLRRSHVRVDLAVVNGSLHGFEIKSDRDSLRRLARQVDLYSQVLDRATLVRVTISPESACAAPSTLPSARSARLSPESTSSFCSAPDESMAIAHDR